MFAERVDLPTASKATAGPDSSYSLASRCQDVHYITSLRCRRPANPRMKVPSGNCCIFALPAEPFRHVFIGRFQTGKQMGHTEVHVSLPCQTVMSLPTPPLEKSSFYRPSAAQASADAIPIRVDNTYHIFHLTTPPFTTHHPPRLRSSWSRIRSRNLVDWSRDEQAVISPGSDAVSPDADGAWTGCAFVGPDERMHIFYTGYNLAQGGKQTILQTVADDKHGSSFPRQGKPIQVINSEQAASRFEDIDFRDAYVFRNESIGEYWMLVATRLSQGPHWSRGCIALLTSPDLESWSMQPEPLYSPQDMHCPECPELFPLPNGKWYLVYSRFAAPDAGTVYRISDSPYGPFRIPCDGSRGRLDGRRWYAAKSCESATKATERVYFGWIADRCEADGKWLWGGDLALPRIATAKPDGHLQIKIAPQVASLFKDNASAVSLAGADLRMQALGTLETKFLDCKTNNVTDDLLVEFEVAKVAASSFGLILRSDVELKAHKIVFNATRHGTFNVVLLCDQPPLDDFWADQYDLHLARPVDGPDIVRHNDIDLSGAITLALRSHCLELFCDGKSISFRLPDCGDHERRLGLFVQDGTVDFRAFTIHAGGVFNRTST